MDRYQKGQEIEVAIRSLGSAGEGVGVGARERFPIFIPSALPGEEVTAHLDQVKKQYAKGRIVKVHRASPERVEPFCPLYNRCGGCQIQHLSYAGQLLAKRQRVVDALERIGRFSDPPVRPCLEAPTPAAYRNKIQMPIAPSSDGITIGFFRRGSHEVVPVERCPIHCEAGETAFAQLRPILMATHLPAYEAKEGRGVLRYLVVKSSRVEGRSLAILVTTGSRSDEVKRLAEEIVERCPAVAGVVENINRLRGNTILTPHFRTLAGSDHLWEELCGKRFRISPASFFQVNPWQAERLYEQALELLNPPSDAHLLDAYCGVGTLSTIASDRVHSVVGVESVPQAVEDARANAERNGAHNCRFVAGKLEEVIAELDSFDYALLNPPRKGCDRAVIDALAERQPKRIAYLSCDPATLARDLALLASEGYHLECVQPVDMFPQTMHVESVALISRLR